MSYSPTAPVTQRQKDIVWLFFNKTGHERGIIKYFSKEYSKHPVTIREILGGSDEEC